MTVERPDLSVVPDAQDFLFVRKFIDKPALHDGGDFAAASRPELPEADLHTSTAGSLAPGTRKLLWRALRPLPRARLAWPCFTSLALSPEAAVSRSIAAVCFQQDKKCMVCADGLTMSYVLFSISELCVCRTALRVKNVTSL